MGKRPVIQLLEPQADSSGPERKTCSTNPAVSGGECPRYLTACGSHLIYSQCGKVSQGARKTIAGALLYVGSAKFLKLVNWGALGIFTTVYTVY